jgi:4-hydroxy-tetrahydrodipicolinate synthase
VLRANRERKASTYVISLTPFDADGNLDEADFRRHLRRLADSGIGVYVGGGGSGEGFTLSLDEVRRVLQIAKEELQGKVPVRAMGREPRSANQLLEYAKIVKEVGLDAFQIYSLEPGHGTIPSEREIEAYFSEVLEQQSMPSVLSTHYSVGYLVPLRLFGRIVERFDHVIGISCTTPSPYYLSELIDLVGNKVEIHVGGSVHILEALALGAEGYLTSDGNLAPKLSVAVTDHHNAGNLLSRDEAAARVIRLEAASLPYGAIRFTKAALQLLGLPGGSPRPPRLPVPKEQLEAIVRTLDDLGLASIEGWTMPEALARSARRSG